MAIELTIPEVGESITEVVIGEWRKNEGDEVAKDEIVVEIETDKTVLEVPSPVDGRLTKIIKNNGEEAAVGDVLGYIEEAAPGSKPAKAKQKEPSAKEPEPDKQPGKKEQVAAEQADKPSVKETSERETAFAATPSARRLLREHGLKPAEVGAAAGSSRITSDAVEAFLRRRNDGAPAARRPVEQADGDRRETRVNMSGIRREIARKMVEAQQTSALLTTFNEIDMSAVQQLRREFGEHFKQQYGVKLGYMSFFVKAVVDALKRHPVLNARVDGKQIVYRDYYDIGVAIGTERGLVVPILRNAEQLSFAEIEMQIADFSQRAANKRLKIEELQGGTFSITNGGVFGSLLSTPLVNPPDSGVLGMHAIQERPIAKDGQVVVRPIMYVALTYDHRIADGRDAIGFLVRFKEAIESPARMLLEI